MDNHDRRDVGTPNQPEPAAPERGAPRLSTSGQAVGIQAAHQAHATTWQPQGSQRPADAMHAGDAGAIDGSRAGDNTAGASVAPDDAFPHTAQGEAVVSAVALDDALDNALEDVLDEALDQALDQALEEVGASRTAGTGITALDTQALTIPPLATVMSGDATASPLAVVGSSLPPESNPADIYLRSLSTAASRATMRSALNSIAALLGTPHLLDDRGKVITYRVCPWHELRYEHTSAIRAVLAARYKPRTANKMLAAVRGTIKEAWRLRLLTAEERDRILDFPTVRGKTLPRGRALSRGELSAVLSACAEGLPPGGIRDAAIIAASYSGLLRRSEVVNLLLADYDPAQGALTIRGAKGNKDAMVYLAPGAQQAITDWIALRGATPGPLFCPYTRGGWLLPRPLHPASVRDLCRLRAEQAVVPLFTPHDLRRTGISDLLDAGVDLGIVKQLARHEHVETTIGYDRRGERAKHQAAQVLHVPYISRQS